MLFNDNKPTPLWFIICGRKILVKTDRDRVEIPAMKSLTDIGLKPLREHYVGAVRGQDCFAAEISEDARIPENMKLYGTRGMFHHVDKVVFKTVLKALHIIEWDKNDLYCSRCASKMEAKKDERAKICIQCGNIRYPRLSPAVIVLVSRGDKILLARSPRFEEELYSVLAGFVEPGETLEDTVKREIKEEVGIDVGEIRYFGSQHWPFPDSLMIAFTAKYAGGEISIDESEIVRAAWFDYRQLPAIPGKLSIAREMIDWFIAERENDKQ